MSLSYSSRCHSTNRTVVLLMSSASVYANRLNPCLGTVRSCCGLASHEVLVHPFQIRSPCHRRCRPTRVMAGYGLLLLWPSNLEMRICVQSSPSERRLCSSPCRAVTGESTKTFHISYLNTVVRGRDERRLRVQNSVPQ